MFWNVYQGCVPSVENSPDWTLRIRTPFYIKTLLGKKKNLNVMIKKRKIKTRESNWFRLKVTEQR